MKQDFEKLERTINIGSFIVLAIAVTFIVLLSKSIIELNKEIELLEASLYEKDKRIKEINKTSYNRFIIAKDLTDICNRFKSSREAKEKYYLDGTL